MSEQRGRNAAKDVSSVFLRAAAQWERKKDSHTTLQKQQKSPTYQRSATLRGVEKANRQDRRERQESI